MVIVSIKEMLHDRREPRLKWMHVFLIIDIRSVSIIFKVFRSLLLPYLIESFSFVCTNIINFCKKVLEAARLTYATNIKQFNHYKKLGFYKIW